MTRRHYPYRYMVTGIEPAPYVVDDWRLYYGPTKHDSDPHWHCLHVKGGADPEKLADCSWLVVLSPLSRRLLRPRTQTGRREWTGTI